MHITGYIDDITSGLGLLLLGYATLLIALGNRQPCIRRFLPVLALASAIITAVLALAFIVAVVASDPPRFIRFDVVHRSSEATWNRLISVLFAFLPAQVFWLRQFRNRIALVVATGLLLLVPLIVSILLFRSSAEAFYFAS